MSKSSHRTAWLGAALLCAASALGSAGCAVADMAEEAWFQTKQTLTPTTGDYLDPTEHVADDWSEVRELGRADQEPLEDDEDWYRKWFMSTKAREVERNLGIE